MRHAPPAAIARGAPRSGIADAARRLLDLADAARRLPPPDRRDPERFHEARDTLASELRALAWRIARSARP